MALGKPSKRRAVKSLVAAVLLILGGCAANQAEVVANRDAWGECVKHAVEQLDDGRSDPVSVANGIAPQCAVQYERLSQTMMSGMITEKGQDFMRGQMKQNEVQLITSAILAHRASKNKNVG
jgi:hypothetical protein